MSITVLDVETTISNKGNPFDLTNKMCVVGINNPDHLLALKIEYDDEPYGDNLKLISNILDKKTSLLIGFNIKFDLNWLHRYGIEYKGKVWDCQLFEHFASNMSWIYPSLEESCIRRSIEGQKYKDIEEYWNNKIDTPQIPWNIIERRVLSDVEITYELYLTQLEEFSTWPKNRQNLFRLQCQDLLVLHQIERNGFYYDEEKSKAEAEISKAVLAKLRSDIYEIVGDTRPNLDSDEHLSAILYGGSITYKTKVANGVYKSGQKKGEVRYSWSQETVVYDRMITPLKGTECDKEDEEGNTLVWSVDKKVLGRLLNTRIPAKVKELIRLLLKYSAEARSLSSYTEGLPDKITEMNWPRNMLYSTINQVVVKTGRTSSSKPNIHNIDGDLKGVFTTRFK